MAELKKQASNIDQHGNVLYLDEKGLERKVVGFPRYKNKPNGLGLFNWILEHVLYMSDKRWPLALKLYKMFVKISVWMKEGGLKAKIYKTGIKLSPDMERQGLNEVGYKDYDLVILENVGNLVCPAEFDTGTVKNMTILSVPEGHDKPLKHPLMYENCQLLVINKMDVLDYFDFDKEKVIEYAKMRNPEIEILFASAKTGDGVSAVSE